MLGLLLGLLEGRGVTRGAGESIPRFRIDTGPLPSVRGRTGNDTTRSRVAGITSVRVVAKRLPNVVLNTNGRGRKMRVRYVKPYPNP